MATVGVKGLMFGSMNSVCNVFVEGAWLFVRRFFLVDNVSGKQGKKSRKRLLFMWVLHSKPTIMGCRLANSSSVSPSVRLSHLCKSRTKTWDEIVTTRVTCKSWTSLRSRSVDN